MVIFDTKGKLASGIPWHVADNRSCMWSALTYSLHVHGVTQTQVTQTDNKRQIFHLTRHHESYRNAISLR
jgi:hypothetical protein